MHYTATTDPSVLHCILKLILSLLFFTAFLATIVLSVLPLILPIQVPDDQYYLMHKCYIRTMVYVTHRITPAPLGLMYNWYIGTMVYPVLHCILHLLSSYLLQLLLSNLFFTASYCYNCPLPAVFSWHPSSSSTFQ